MTTHRTQMPLFPLQHVLFPDEALPLHIFEARYQAMIRRCQETGGPFGIVLLQGEDQATVGCEAKLSNVVRHHPDGRSDILVRGGERFRVRSSRLHTDAYLEAETEPYADKGPHSVPEVATHLLQLFEAYLYETNEPDPEDEAPPDPSRPGYTFRIAARAMPEIAPRQRLLEMRSEAEREQALFVHLLAAIPKARQRREDQQHVKGNGHLRPAE